MMPRLALPMKEAAGALGVSYDVLKDWVAAGAIPHFRLGRRVMFSVKALESWMAEKEIPAFSDAPFRERRRSSRVNSGRSIKERKGPR